MNKTIYSNLSFSTINFTEHNFSNCEFLFLNLSRTLQIVHHCLPVPNKLLVTKFVRFCRQATFLCSYTIGQTMTFTYLWRGMEDGF